MAIAKVQSVTGNGASVVLNGVVAGNALTLQYTYLRGTTTGLRAATPTDSSGSFTASAGDFNPLPAVFSGGDNGIGTWIHENCSAGTHTVTPEANTIIHSTLTEFSGLATSASQDVAKSASTINSNQTSQVTGTTAATAQASELALICLNAGAAVGVANMGLTDPVTGFTTLQVLNDTNADIGVMHNFKVLSATGTQSATYTWTDNETQQVSIANIATFKAAASADIGVGSGVFHGDGPGMGPRLRRMMPQQFATPGPVDTVTPAPQIQPLRARGPGFGPRLRRMMPQQFAVPGAAIVGGKVGAWTWLGLASALSTIIAAKVGAYTWKGDTSPLSTEIVAKVGAWTWAGDRSPLSAEIVSRTGAYTWAGVASPLSAEIRSALGAYTWAGLRSPLSSEIVTRVGSYTWAGSSATFGSAIQAKIGAYTWSGIQSPPVSFLNAGLGNYSWAGVGAPLASTASQVTPGKLPPWPWTWTHDSGKTASQEDYSKAIERAMLREQRARAERRRLEQELRAKAAQKPNPKALAPERAQQISLQNRDYAILRRKIKAAEAEHTAAVTREIELRLRTLENEQTVSETVAARRKRELMMVLLLA